MIRNIKNKKKITKRDIFSVFVRSNLFQGSWNFERMQSLGFCFSIIPIIKKLYSNDEKEKRKAIRRHLEFFNTHPYSAAPILGVTIAMEEERSNGKKIKSSSINGIKVGLMGPLAGIGDPIFWGTVRPILSALGASIAITGNIIGPFLFFLLFNSIRMTIRYLGIIYGYRKGLNIIKDMGSGILKKITEGSSVLGLFIMGALVNKWTHINIPVIVSKSNLDGKHIITTVQSILDQLLPGIVPLMLTFLCMWLLRLGVSPFWIILGFFIFGIIGYWIGLLGL